MAIKGPLTTPIGHGIRSVNVALRRELDLFALVRPTKSYPGVRSRYSDVDLVVIRENTEDLYAGIEFEEGKDETHEVIGTIERLSGRTIRPDFRDQHQADEHHRHQADLPLRLPVGHRQRPAQGDLRAQGEHHEIHRGPVAARRAGCRQGVP